MNTFVLIHGAWHGAWCWHKIIPLLTEKGYEVIAPDLPGHGKEMCDINAITLERYTESVCAVIRKSAGPIILVGHSMAGIVLSSVAEFMPDRITRLVYLSGFMLENGQTMLEITRADTQAVVFNQLEFSRDRKAARVRDDAIVPAFYHDCSDSDIEMARLHLTAEPLAPIATPVCITSQNWGRVPRSYIQCRQDNAVSIAAQQAMCAALPCERTESINSSHSPFLSVPEKLVSSLLDATAPVGQS